MRISIVALVSAFLVLSVFSNICTAQEKNVPDRGSVDKMIRTVETIQKELNRCESDLCETIGKNADARHGYLLKAKKAFREGEHQVGFDAIEEVHKIIKSDIERLSTDKLPRQLSSVLRYEKELERQVEMQLHKKPGRTKF